MSPTLALLLLAAGNPPTVPVPAFAPACAVCPPGAPGMPRGACPPLGPAAPLLGVRVLAPDGVTVAFAPEDPAARTYPVPATAGFRPGYRFTIRLTNLPGRNPTEAIYPVLEVHGSLVPRAGLKYLDYPAPLAVTRGDIDRALAGSQVTKIVYLEDPTKAIPVAATPDVPLEFTEVTERDALAAAHDNGRLVMILRFGDRKPEADDLARGAVPGTVLLPGEKVLAAPRVPPLFNAFGVAMFDPIAGPKLAPEECITDGGDKFPALGIGPNRLLGGLNPTDVAVEYTAGLKRRVATSNEVCICAPRYVLRKVELTPGGVQLAAGVAFAEQAGGLQVGSRAAAPEAYASRAKPVSADGRVRPSITYVKQGIAVAEALQKVQAITTLEGVKVLVSSVEADEVTNGPNQMIVTKSVSPVGPVQSGDTVTFTIQYRNATPHAATDLLLSDSLSGRLEYVPGTAASDRPANRTAIDNEAGSVTLRFEIPGPIAPGASGTIKFQAKVR